MKGLALSLFLFLILFTDVTAQTATPTPTPTPEPAATQFPAPEKHFFKHLIKDQVTIWTSPFKLDREDAKWAVPLFVSAGALMATDRYTSNWVISDNSLHTISHDVSRGGEPYVTVGTAAGFYLAGRFMHDPRARETGVLSLEALINTGIVTAALKAASNRVRPSGANERSEFWDGGTSFPSGHASSIWALATVVAYEYQKEPIVKYGAIAAAAVVSISRFTGSNHFLSDILIGSAIGYGIGRYTFREYHNADIDKPRPKKITDLRPEFVPYYNPRTRSYGGSLVFTL